ncbi:hypothetical protein EYZ11_013238 [Aspergillus tanneri]|uniref:Uncharacterized protein n=1 Tax=Aspergillus tanneri TaxID=1220188 RepID=A0A4S3J0A1_9EURO|nr:hypothetical protein EYZ11_013238 [Aspergillus tanneri]
MSHLKVEQTAAGFVSRVRVKPSVLLATTCSLDTRS